MTISQLTIFGAGLIGGSIALRARAHQLAERLVAVDLAPRPSGDVPFDEWLMVSQSQEVNEALRSTSLAILCMPVGSIIKALPQILSATQGTVSDCGSTKAVITASVSSHPARARFVPGHPMAGHPEGGLQNARADLFEGRRWILCSEASDAGSSSLVENLVRGLGAQVVNLPATEHDRSVAITSHLPQVVASALSVFAEEEDAKRAAGPGFASATRVAGGAESMWRDIFETNAHAVGTALHDLGKKLELLGDELCQGNVRGTLDTLEKARKLRGDP